MGREAVRPQEERTAREKEMPAERRAQAVRELLRPEAGTRAVRVRARAVPQEES